MSDMFKQSQLEDLLLQAFNNYLNNNYNNNYLNNYLNIYLNNNYNNNYLNSRISSCKPSSLFIVFSSLISSVCMFAPTIFNSSSMSMIFFSAT